MRLEIVCFAVKFLGCASVLAGCAGTGVLWCADITKRKKMLEDFHQMILRMQGDIRFFGDPLSVVMDHLKNMSMSACIPFWEAVGRELKNECHLSFIQVWMENVNKYLKGTCLKEEDLEIIRDLGRMLGTHDRLMQNHVLDMFAARMEIQIQTVTAQMADKKRMYGGLWVLGGIFLVVLFI